MQGAVHGLSCVAGFTVRLGQLGLARSRSGVCVCVVGAAWRDVWRDLGGGGVYVLLCAATDWVIDGGRSMFSLWNVACVPWASWERHPSCLG